MNDTTAAIFELTLLYVLSAAATFWFCLDRTKRGGKKFPVGFAIVAALGWPVFFVYAVVREFRK
jgi:hypothetical protein